MSNWSSAGEVRGTAVARALASAVLFAAVTAFDQASRPAATSAAVLMAACLGACAAVIAATLLWLWTLTSSRLGRVSGVGLWLCLGGGVAVAIASDLGLEHRFAGGRAPLAIAAALSLSLGAGVFTLVGALLVPGRDGRSWLGAQPRSLRFAAAACAVSVALLLNQIERGLLVGPYAVARVATGIAMFGALLLASVCVAERGFGLRSRGRAGVVALLSVVGLVPFAAIRAPEVATAYLDAQYPGLLLRGLQRAFDWDRDGYSALLGGGDCNDWNAGINPGHDEVPRNGRDDNCFGGDSPLRSWKYDPESVPRAERPSPVSVVLITVDTLSASHMSAYGYSRPTTPHIDGWAREHARLFENAYTPATSTQFALSAVMRGVYSRRLHWSSVEFRDDDGVKRTQTMPVGEWRRTLPEWLSRRGMRTLALTDDGDSRYLDIRQNVGGRFDEWTDARQLFPETDDAALSREAIARLEKLPQNRRFLWVHYFGPHAPTKIHPELPQFGDTTADQYDHEILALDCGLALLLEELSARQRRGEPLVIALLGDHGEDLGEHERTHGRTLSEQSARVPLLISAPGLEPGRISSLVSTIDLFPTLLGYTETPAPPELDGRDLRPPFTAAASPARIVFVEGWAERSDQARHLDEAMASDGSYRFVRHLNPSSVEFRPTAGVAADIADPVRRSILGQALDGYLDQAQSSAN